jgi:class 3 adenylate cyclase
VSVQSRRLVTVIFTDVTGSTPLAETLDPEPFRELMDLFFRRMTAVIEAHGGTVEKFIGDAVMAVFGIPEIHEDDPLRAVRAAMEMREALGVLNAEIGEWWGVQIETRTGVNTGPVVAGDPSTDQAFATGDTVNVAARLEQVAEPGTIVISGRTHRQVRDAVKVAELGSL